MKHKMIAVVAATALVFFGFGCGVAHADSVYCYQDGRWVLCAETN